MGLIDFDDFDDDVDFDEITRAVRENLERGRGVPPPDPPVLRPIRPSVRFPTEPNFPDLADIDGLIEAFVDAIDRPLTLAVDDVSQQVDRVIQKIELPLGAIEGTLDLIIRSINSTFNGILEGINAEGARVTSRIGNTVEVEIGNVNTTIGVVLGRLTDVISTTLEDVGTTVGNSIDEIGFVHEASISALAATVGNLVSGLEEKIGGAILSTARALDQTLGKPFTKLADALPFQVANLGETISDSLSGIAELPEQLGDKIREIFSELSTVLGLDNLLHFTQILQAVFSIGDYHNQIKGELPTLLNPSGGVHSSSDSGFIATSAIPFLGSSILLSNPGIVERIRGDSLEHERPTIFSVPDGLELLRRFPDESDQVIADLKRQGWSDDRVESLTRLRFQLTPVADTLEAWRRGFVDDDGLATKLTSLGWSEADQALLQRLTFRIPPIQDMILFAIRGVFDVEESRAFGEFEGLPSALEQAFIQNFDIEGGDFSRQVEVFATEAQKLGLSPEWVAAYWTSHWRLPSLQTAYEMFHRLQPDILEAEADRVTADGFSVQELEFTRPELDRLVRAQDFSSFWRPKLSAIAFNPLTRVDIRRMSKLGLLDREAMVRAYRKVGFSPSDAELMAKFTEAFNGEPDSDQAREVRDLTKTVVLDFVENSLFSPEEGVERLQAIGYDEFAAEALVDLELAKLERGLQRDQIDLIEEQVKLGILGLNEASIDLDSVGIPAAQKEVIIRKLTVQISPRPASPSKADLDNFLNQQVIDTTDYRLGLAERGFTDFWIDHYIALDRRLRTKKDLDGLFIAEIIRIDEYEVGLVDLGYSPGTIQQFITLINQAKEEAEEEEV